MSDFLRTRRWANLGSFRAWFGTMIVALIPGGLLGAVWAPLGTVVFIAVAVAWTLVVQLAPERVLYCPYCKKRVKAGATRCHHCHEVVA